MTVEQQDAVKAMSKKTRPKCEFCDKLGHTESECRMLKSSIADLKKENAKKSVAFSFFRSSMALLSILHSDSVFPSFTEFTLRSRLLVLRFHSILLLHCHFDPFRMCYQPFLLFVFLVAH